MPRHLLEGHARAVHELTRGLVHLVVAAEVARVVVGHVAVDRRDRDEALLPHEAVEQLGVVDHLVLAAERSVLVLQRVEAVRTGHDDLAVRGGHAVERVVQRLDVLLGEHLEQELVARAAGRVTVTGLALTEHRELHTGGVQQGGDGLRGLLGAVLEGAGAADPEQVLGVAEVLDVLADHRDVEVEGVHPLVTTRVVLAPGVALVLEVLEQAGELGRELRLDEHLVAAHVDEVVDVLDVDRALLDAGATGGAGPQGLGVDDACGRRVLGDVGGGVADQGTLGLEAGGLGDLGQLGLVRVAVGVDQAGLLAHGGLTTGEQVGGFRRRVVAQRHDHELRAQGLTGVPRGALFLAATTLGAGGEVQPALPREVLDRTGAQLGLEVLVLFGELLDLLHGQRDAVHGHGLEGTQRGAAVGLALEVDVEEGGETVPGDAPRDVAAHDVEPDHAGEQLDQREDRDHQLVRGQDRRERAGDPVGGPVEVLAVGAVERELAGLDEDHAQALEEHDGLDEVGGLAVGTDEAVETTALVNLADDDECGDADDGAQSQDLVDDVIPGLLGQPGPATAGVERLDVGLEPDDRAQHEADHDEPVEEAHRALARHPGVGAHLDEDVLEPGQDRPEAVESVLLSQEEAAHHAGDAADERGPAEQTEQDADRPECDGHA